MQSSATAGVPPIGKAWMPSYGDVNTACYEKFGTFGLKIRGE